jgi:hypothetical protein
MFKRGVSALVCAALIAVAMPATPAPAAEIYPIVFPVVGENHYTDTYDACRDGCARTHQATDIMAAKMTPVVAAADGTVTWMSGTCCSMELTHDDGYQSWYIHINNDTPGTDDGQAWGFAPGIDEGVHVNAGELIGWVGDSGNAEHVGSHLHFQLHYPDGTRFNPYESLLAATHVNPIAADEIFFYRNDGLFRYYDINPDASLGSPLASGDNYTHDWSTITAIDLDGDDADEMFFYRDDGLFRYYDIRPNGSIPKPMTAGDNYTTGWDSISAIDLDGDGQDEMFFYREDGLYRFYDIRPDGSLPKPISSGSDYPTGWTTITAIDLNGDGHDEILFYRDNGEYGYYPVGNDGVLGDAILSGADYTAGWTSIASVNLDG